MNPLSAALLGARLDRGLTRREVSRRADVTENELYRWETRTRPGGEGLLRVMLALGVEAPELSERMARWRWEQDRGEDNPRPGRKRR